MATPREIKKRINSVKNTKKITRTMEMVATAKSKKMSNKVNASKPFSEKLNRLITSLYPLASVIDSPILKKREVKKVAILVVTANRGLCGGYNSNILRMAKNRIAELKKQGMPYEISVVGKKGASFFRFIKETVKNAYLNIDDSSGYKEAEIFANYYLNAYASGEIDKLEVITTVYYSSSQQKAECITLLPLEAPEGEKSASNEPVIYEPEPEKLLVSLLPLMVKTMFYRIILEAICSEYIARRIAMKSATDAANEMIRTLTLNYNRIRQAKITQEISEIVGGAASLN